jgi:hypothetical protein
MEAHQRLISGHTPWYYYKRLREAMRGKRAVHVGYSEGELSLRYHDTVVARYYFDTDTLILEHNGFRTATTKSRINDFCDVLGLRTTVSQHAKRWYITIMGGPQRGEHDWGHIYDCDDDERTFQIQVGG